MPIPELGIGREFLDGGANSTNVSVGPRRQSHYSRDISLSFQILVLPPHRRSRSAEGRAITFADRVNPPRTQHTAQGPPNTAFSGSAPRPLSSQPSPVRCNAFSGALKDRPARHRCACRYERASSVRSPRHHESEDVVRPAVAGKRLVGPALPLDRPSDAEQRRQDAGCPSRRPGDQAAMKEMVSSSGPASPCSSRSATTRSASAWARACASRCVGPYARTPGRSGTSAIHRPSSSCSSSIVSFRLRLPSGGLSLVAIHKEPNPRPRSHHEGASASENTEVSGEAPSWPRLVRCNALLNQSRSAAEVSTRT